MRVKDAEREAVGMALRDAEIMVSKALKNERYSRVLSTRKLA